MIIINRKYPQRAISSFIISLSQIIANRVILLLYRVIGDIEVTSDVKLIKSKRYLFLSNHQSRLDPFVAFAGLSLKDNLATAPVRFLTAGPIYYSWLYLWLKSMGCYPTKNRRLTVPESVDLLKKGYNVFIFPEGRRTLRKDSDPKIGTRLIIDSLQEQTIRFTIVLIHIEWQRKGWRRYGTVKIAEASQHTYQDDMKSIMQTIYAL